MRAWNAWQSGAFVEAMTDTNTSDPHGSASDRLSRRIEVARSRAADRGRRAADAAGGAAGDAAKLIREHPVVAIGGALLVGAVIAQTLPRKVTKRARKRSKRALGLAAGAAELALAYGRKTGASAADNTREGADWLGHVVRLAADAVGNGLAQGSDSARKGWLELAGISSEKAREAGNLAADQLRKVAKRLES